MRPRIPAASCATSNWRSVEDCQVSGMLHRGQIKPKPSCETYLLMGSWKNGRKSAVEVLLIACNRTNKAEPGSAVFVATAKRPRATSSMSPLKWARLKTEMHQRTLRRRHVVQCRSLSGLRHFLWLCSFQIAFTATGWTWYPRPCSGA